MSATIDALIRAEHLPAGYADTVDRWWRPLATAIAAWHDAAKRPLVIGVNGAQGSGKTTLCRFLEDVLLPELGLAAVTVSLDDLYLSLADRLRLARDVHPLLRTRGVPGTHDVALGSAVLDDLVAGRDTCVPRFSKAQDDRLPRASWTARCGRADIVLFEGWCVGARAQPGDALRDPVNALERESDGDGAWRGYVNDALAGAYANWFARIDRLIMLKPPTFDCVVRNRLLQEAKLRRAAPGASGLMSDEAVRRFVSHYERTTRDMFATLPSRADLVVALDDDQNVRSLTSRQGA